MHTLSVAELSKSLKNKEFSSVELTQHYLDRISHSDLNAFITVTDELALSQARAADAKLANGSGSVLTGIPFAQKDIFCTNGIKTTCGSKMLDNFVAPYDATVIKKMSDAGFIMIGKTNMDEFAMGSSNETSFFGSVKNPWDYDYVPGGSSGGSAASVAARLAPCSTGTDTGGSIRHPSSHCGITGLRPTHGLISAQGVLPLGKTADSVGPMTRTVTDIGIMLEAMLDSDLGSCDYTSVFNLTDLEGIRIGIDSSWIEEASHKEVLSLFRKGVEAFRNSGAVIIDIKIPEPKDLGFLYRDIVNYEAYRYHRTIFEMNGSSYGPEARRRMESGRSVTDVEYNSALIKKQKLVLAASDIFNRIDVMISPTQVKTAPKLEKRITESNLCSTASQTGFSSSMGAFLGFASFTGFPGLSIPMGFDSLGLPAGLQIIGPAFGENICLQVGHCYQMATNWHQHHPAIDFN